MEIEYLRMYVNQMDSGHWISTHVIVRKLSIHKVIFVVMFLMSFYHECKFVLSWNIKKQYYIRNNYKSRTSNKSFERVDQNFPFSTSLLQEETFLSVSDYYMYRVAYTFWLCQSVFNCFKYEAVYKYCKLLLLFHNQW